VVRVKRCGKSAPAFRVTGVARQTPPEARPRRPHSGAVAQAFEGCSPEPAGRPLEAPGNGVSRWMVAAALPGNAEQNPAYRPTRPPCPLGVLPALVIDIVCPPTDTDAMPGAGRCSGGAIGVADRLGPQVDYAGQRGSGAHSCTPERVRTLSCPTPFKLLVA
jgi:hypothetical protein